MNILIQERLKYFTQTLAIIWWLLTSIFSETISMYHFMKASTTLLPLHPPMKKLEQLTFLSLNTTTSEWSNEALQDINFEFNVKTSYINWNIVCVKFGLLRIIYTPAVYVTLFNVTFYYYINTETISSTPQVDTSSQINALPCPFEMEFLLLHEYSTSNKVLYDLILTNVDYNIYTHSIKTQYTR